MNHITEVTKHMTCNWITLKLMIGDSERSLFLNALIMLLLGPHFGRGSVDILQAQAACIWFLNVIYQRPRERTVGSLVKSAIDYTTKERW